MYDSQSPKVFTIWSCTGIFHLPWSKDKFTNYIIGELLVHWNGMWKPLLLGCGCLNSICGIRSLQIEQFCFYLYYKLNFHSWTCGRPGWCVIWKHEVGFLKTLINVSLTADRKIQVPKKSKFEHLEFCFYNFGKQKICLLEISIDVRSQRFKLYWMFYLGNMSYTSC